LDHVDVVYYQGFILNLDQEEGGSILARSSLQGGTFSEPK
jgi:hypothetical protein